MASKGHPKSKKPAIKCKLGQVDGESFKLEDFVFEDIYTQRGKISKSSEILSTAKLKRSFGQLWDLVSHPLANSQPNENLKECPTDSEKEKLLCYLGREDNARPFTSSAGSDPSTIMPQSSESARVKQALPSSEAFVNYKHSFLQPLFWGRIYRPSRTCKRKGLESIEMLHDLGYLYGWMRQGDFSGSKYSINSFQIENRETVENCASGDMICSVNTCISESANSPLTSLVSGTADCNSFSTKCKDFLLGENADISDHARISSCPRYSDHVPEVVREAKVDKSVSLPPISHLCTDHVDSLSSGQCPHGGGNGLLEKKIENPNELATDVAVEMDTCSSKQDKSCHPLAKKEHAIAGACAGVFVSLCLHPFDTVKTIIQSCHGDERSIFNIGRRIISERGLSGFYRGISSNIASSAPISAVYTFTYESVKASLLPYIPKGYHSFAHCAAGGCASIATSFIFTPTECIKQQMQVHLQYQNCWKAFVGIIRKGGLPSLYAGWGAVLCRNVPHSIIKFYTYESLKQLTSSSLQCNAPPNTLQTLVCGGLAGSTAALFTTPFDVIKTRLQTQIPGSTGQYEGVFHALKEIAKHEGLRGLYRGLTARLIMYMSQGALFFASYEGFKILLSLETPQLDPQTIHYEENLKDDSTYSMPSPSPP
ncbi:Mitochondrial substrate/solute carrier [Dillenia turbinata]|uniref:Mitochondrial substrate/solute carrier n=1 Tax=Dillenia turbinata TaxID=194707 RepID=A0AAN8VJT5_9MAGN